jgi:hypothetical protein
MIANNHCANPTAMLPFKSLCTTENAADPRRSENKKLTTSTLQRAKLHTEEAYKAFGGLQKGEGVDASIGDWHICKGLMDGTQFILIITIAKHSYFNCLEVGRHVFFGAQ